MIIGIFRFDSAVNYFFTHTQLHQAKKARKEPQVPSFTKNSIIYDEDPLFKLAQCLLLEFSPSDFEGARDCVADSGCAARLASIFTNTSMGTLCQEARYPLSPPHPILPRACSMILYRCAHFSLPQHLFVVIVVFVITCETCD